MLNRLMTPIPSMHFVVWWNRGQRTPMAALMPVLWKVGLQKLLAPLAYLTPVQRLSARMKLSVGWHGPRQVVEPTDHVVAQQLAVAKHGGFSQHLWGWQMTGHVTQKNLVKL
jgi:hypothetical protein